MAEKKTKPGARTGKRTRETRETRIQVNLNLDGSGKYSVDLGGDPFLRHMLESFARFGQFDLEIQASGDFDHHVWEDTAIVLGKTLRDLIEGKKLARNGHAILPMDEALVLVALDLVDRPYSEVDLPDDMMEHFLRSFAMEARITLHTQVLRGRNAHHIIEATFKAMGLALRDATRPSSVHVSTKGLENWVSPGRPADEQIGSIAKKKIEREKDVKNEGHRKT